MKFLCLSTLLVVLASATQARRTIEIYFVADHKALMRYMGEESSVADAKQSMTNDINYFITQMNVHYESLGQLDIVISKRGLRILGEDLFTSANGRIVPAVGLDTFRQWLRSENAYQTLNYDLALLFTGYDLAKSNKDNSTAGLAGVGVVCRQGAAIVEYDGTYNTVAVAAHEIGHNLGADHDPTGTGFIMAPSTNAQSKTRWDFSSKSYSEISSNLNRVSHSQRGDCLTKQSPDSVVPHSRVPAVLAQPDGVCTRKFGPESYFCRMGTDVPKGDDMCNSFYCNSGFTNGTCVGATSSDGLVCGAGKACQKGRCVVDRQSSTQHLDENCLYGDQKKITNDNKFLTCPQWLAKGISGCNSAYTRIECCGTCAKKATENPDCPYGDQEVIKFSNRKETTTCAEYLKGVSCTMASVRSLCCGTCGQTATGNPDCPYGDETLNYQGEDPISCADYLKERGATVCQQDYVKRKCCASCAKADTGNPACRYGDAASVSIRGIGKMTCGEFVSKYGQNQCDMDWMKQSCCQTCGVKGGSTGGNTGGHTGGNTGGNTGSGGSGGSCSDRLTITSGGKPLSCAQYVAAKGGAKCNTPSIKDGCCASCAKKATGNLSCPYGDLKDITFSNIPHLSCSQILSKYGDSQCYREDFKNKFCCDTCARRTTGIEGCAYGDRSDDCKKYSPSQICRGESNKKLCCKKCSGYVSRGRREQYQDEDGETKHLFVPHVPVTNIPEPIDMKLVDDQE